MKNLNLTFISNTLDTKWMQVQFSMEVGITSETVQEERHPISTLSFIIPY